MKRRPTVLAQMGTLVLATLLAVLAISFAVVLLTPTPQPAPVRLRDLIEAVRQPSHGGRLGFRAEVRETPPAGRSSPLLTRALSRSLGLDTRNVRIIWPEGRATALVSTVRGESVTLIAGREAVVTATPDGFSLRSGPAVPLSPQALIPPVIAAVARDDGRWLVLDPADPLLPAWRRRMLLAFLLSAAVLAPVAWFMARRLTSPIRALAAAAERARLWRDDTPIPGGGPREVVAAAEAIGAMRARLAAEAAERTRMVAAVAHDLRNPLTGLRLRTENIVEPARDRMIEDIKRMEAMIDQMLAYAEGQERRGPSKWVDLAALAGQLAEEARALGLPVTFAAARAAWAYADPEAVGRAVNNLMDNALRYAGGASLLVREERDDVLIVVEDDGPGIPEERLEEVVKPFERVERSRSRNTGGAGLGLAIVRDIAEGHNGALLLRNKPAGGLSAELRLPRGRREGRSSGHQPTSSV